MSPSIAAPLVRRRLFPLRSLQSRPFSVSRPAFAALSNPGRRGPSMTTFKEDAIAERADFQDLISEIGPLEGTFVKGPASTRPSLTKEPANRFKYEKEWLLSRLTNWVSLFIFKYYIASKPRPKLAFSKRAPAAKDLYEKLYTAFAAGDIAALRPLTGASLLKSLRLRHSLRPHNDRQSWRVLKYLSRPRVVSDRAAKLPVEDVPGCGLRQVVVRLHTKQLLEKWKVADKSGAKLTEPKKIEKEATEYIVLQQLMWEEKLQPWKVWGFIQPSTLESIQQSKANAAAMMEAARKRQR